MLSATTEDGSRDSLELRYPPRRHVFLHRAAETVGSLFERCEDRLGSDLSPLGYPDGTGLINALLQACPPARVRPDNPERALRSRGGQRKRRQEAELAPEHGGLIVLHFAAQPGITQFFAQGLRSLPRWRIRRELHIIKRREVPNLPRPRSLSFDPYRTR